MEPNATVTIQSRHSGFLSAMMLEKEIKIFQPKEKDPKKSETSKIKDEKKMCVIQKQAALDMVNAFSLSPW